MKPPDAPQAGSTNRWEFTATQRFPSNCSCRGIPRSHGFSFAPIRANAQFNNPANTFSHAPAVFVAIGSAWQNTHDEQAIRLCSRLTGNDMLHLLPLQTRTFLILIGES
jgi:hypothetical protein